MQKTNDNTQSLAHTNKSLRPVSKANALTIYTIKPYSWTETGEHKRYPFNRIHKIGWNIRLENNIANTRNSRRRRRDLKERLNSAYWCNSLDQTMLWRWPNVPAQTGRTMVTGLCRVLYSTMSGRASIGLEKSFAFI